MTRKCPLRKRRLHFYSSKKKTQLNEKHEKRKISICLPIIFMTSNLPFFFFHFFPKNWKTLSPCSFLLFKILNKRKWHPPSLDPALSFYKQFISWKWPVVVISNTGQLIHVYLTWWVPLLRNSWKKEKTNVRI